MSDPVVEEILHLLASASEEDSNHYAAYSKGAVYTYPTNPREEFTLEHGYPINGTFVGRVNMGLRNTADLLFLRSSPRSKWRQAVSALETLHKGRQAVVSADGTILVDGEYAGWTYPTENGNKEFYTRDGGVWYLQDVSKTDADNNAELEEPPTPEYTGGSSSYYTVHIANPTTEGRLPYTAECNDIIEALGMNYAEGNAFKAIWRRAAARTLGLTKKGYDDGLYDAEKVEFFGKRLVVQSKNAS